MDGASTDETLSILRAHPHPARIVVSEPDGGIYDALNKGIAQASGEIIGFLHADDVLADHEVLADIVAAFGDPKVCAVYGDLQYVSRANLDRTIRHWRAGRFSADKLFAGWMPPHPTLYLRKSIYEEFGVFDCSYRIAADYEFMLRILMRLPADRVAYIDRTLVKMRQGGASNKSPLAFAQKSLEDWRALRAAGFGLWAAARALAQKNLGKLSQFWT